MFYGAVGEVDLLGDNSRYVGRVEPLRFVLRRVSWRHLSTSGLLSAELSLPPLRAEDIIGEGGRGVPLEVSGWRDGGTTAVREVWLVGERSAVRAGVKPPALGL